MKTKIVAPMLELNMGRLWFIFSFMNFFSDNTIIRIFILFVAQSAKFFQYLTLDYMTKTLNQIFFFPPPKSEYFFSNIGNQNIFLEKKHSPSFPLEVKWTVPYE